MVKNFFTIAMRRLIGDKAYSIVNIFGLSMGLACFTLIGLWVVDEISFDRFHVKADRIYRVASSLKNESGTIDQAVTSLPLGPALSDDLPEIANVVRIDKNDNVVEYAGSKFIEDGIMGVDETFFSVFDFKLLKGDPATALSQPYTIVLSESTAKKYFGDKDPVGETLRIFQYDPDGRGANYKVTGVVRDCPVNSHFKYNFLFSFKTVEVNKRTATSGQLWFDNGYYTYILLKPDADVKGLNAKLSDFPKKYVGTEMKKFNVSLSYFLQPLTKIHLQSQLRNEINATGSLNYVIIFGTIGFIVLILACINYINMSTAYATKRFKEVGVRKVMGAFKQQLIIQYLVESWLIVMASLVIAFVWMELARPLFESQTSRPLTGLYSLPTMITLVIIASVVGIAAGLYPAFILSSFRPSTILKGGIHTQPLGIWLRKALVIVQYSITIILVTAILVVQLQLNFIEGKDLGYDSENLLVLNVHGSREVVLGYDAFANQLLSNRSIKSMARSNTSIGGGLDNTTASFADGTGKNVNAALYSFEIDSDYIATHGMTLVAGRNLMPGVADTMAYIVNEATPIVYGYKDPKDIVGEEIFINGKRRTIVGVVRNFHYDSFRHLIEPACMNQITNNYFSRITIKLQGDLSNGIDYVSKTWKNLFPGSVLEYSFAEERIESKYKTEKRLSQIFYVFSSISLIIAGLGLFALVSHSLKSRKKEIGIRKVLGASVFNIVGMISKEFLLLVAISCTIALPIAYYFIDEWLQEFVYRVDIGPGIGLFAGGIALLMALATVSVKAFTSAMANPTDSLRSE